MKKNQINIFGSHPNGGSKMSTREELESRTKEELIELVLKLQASPSIGENNKNNKRKFDQLENSPEKPVSINIKRVP